MKINLIHDYRGISTQLNLLSEINWLATDYITFATIPLGGSSVDCLEETHWQTKAQLTSISNELSLMMDKSHIQATINGIDYELADVNYNISSWLLEITLKRPALGKWQLARRTAIDFSGSEDKLTEMRNYTYNTISLGFGLLKRVELTKISDYPYDLYQMPIGSQKLLLVEELLSDDRYLKLESGINYAIWSSGEDLKFLVPPAGNILVTIICQVNTIDECTGEWLLKKLGVVEVINAAFLNTVIAGWLIESNATKWEVLLQVAKSMGVGLRLNEGKLQAYRPNLTDNTHLVYTYKDMQRGLKYHTTPQIAVRTRDMRSYLHTSEPVLGVYDINLGGYRVSGIIEYIIPSDSIVLMEYDHTVYQGSETVFSLDGITEDDGDTILLCQSHGLSEVVLGVLQTDLADDTIIQTALVYDVDCQLLSKYLTSFLKSIGDELSLSVPIISEQPGDKLIIKPINCAFLLLKVQSNYNSIKQLSGYALI